MKTTFDMTGEQVRRWIASMLANGLARSEADCARQLRISPVSLLRMKDRGADYRTLLACTSILAGLAPFR